MELCHSKNLVKLPDLSQAPNLLYLDLEGCVKLAHLDPSIGSLEKLCFLNLENCENLVSIPNSIFDLNSLHHLNLSGCSKLIKYQLLDNPWQTEQLKMVDTSESVQSHMTSPVCQTLTRSIRFFYSKRRANLADSLVSSLPRFPTLVVLDISFCNLLQIPDAIGQLQCLERLNIGGNNFITLPHCIEELPKLRELNLEYCMHLKWLPSTLLPMGRSSYGGLYVFNCPNLSNTEGYRLTAISWLIKVIQQVNMQCSFPGCIIKVVIPGNKIPRWFNKQNTGRSMMLDPSPILFDNNWIGIAYCVTFVVHDAPTQFLERRRKVLVGCGFHFKPHRSIHPTVPICLKKDMITAELDHMLLIFFSREDFIIYVSYLKEGAYDIDCIELDTTSDYPEEVVEVKSCGYRWVFKEDVEQLNPTTMYSANSSTHKHKFLEIEDGQ
ncbi:hypothetical protein PIB30_017101 [Stylosanthes scabra]|uniref:C-JID domain-containing protein n=1 Tax=Stylosanthes scabra TaxID=79078 RepID=A0ABU6U6B0_9FABA|nr:hypothetical protein [Stylosanthes scabra]